MPCNIKSYVYKLKRDVHMFEILLNSMMAIDPSAPHTGSQGLIEANPPFTYTVSNCGMCVVDDEIFFSGGNNQAGTLTATVAKFNTVTKIWTKLADLPAAIGAVRFNAMCNIGGLIYVIGNNKTMGILNPETGLWSTRIITGAPEFLLGSAFTHDDQYIYQICGGGSATGRNILRYDVFSGVCTTLPLAPVSRAYGSGVYHQGKLYIMGKNVNLPEDELYVLDLTNPVEWVATGMKTPMSNAVHLHSYKDNLFSIGGFSGSPPTSIPQIFEYAPSSNRVSINGVQTTPRFFISTAIDKNGKIWYYGGQRTSATIVGDLTYWNVGWP